MFGKEDNVLPPERLYYEDDSIELYQDMPIKIPSYRQGGRGYNLLELSKGLNLYSDLGTSADIDSIFMITAINSTGSSNPQGHCLSKCRFIVLNT